MSFGDLRRLWFERCELDIATCIEKPFTDERVPLRRCATCGLEFFPSALCGTAALYDHLGRYSYYYQPDRWEFTTALNALVAAPARALEVGCGPGRFLELLRAKYPNCEIAGTELNPTAVDEAQARGLNVHLQSLGDMAAHQPDAFDAVFAFQVLEHVPAPAQFLRDAIRALRSGGRLVLGLPNGRGFANRAVNDFGNLPPHHLTRWTRDVFDRLADAYGIDVVGAEAEPVAPYHREWYRTTKTINALGAMFGTRWRLIELGTGYRLCNAVALRVQRLIPDAMWSYRGGGHTMIVTLEKRS